MTKYFRRTLLGSAVAMACLSSSAWATFYTAIADIETSATPTYTTDVIEISWADLSGQSYNNNVEPGQNNDPYQGGKVNVIAGNLLATYVETSGVSPHARWTDAQGTDWDIAVVVAMSGGSDNDPTQPTFTAESGALALFAVAPDTFNKYDPSSWGATTDNGFGTTVLATPLAVFDLAPAEAVAQGPAEASGNFIFTKAQVNQQSLNVVDPNASQGNYLWQPENGGPLTNADSTDLYPDPGKDWLTVTDPVSDGENEGIITSIDETITANLPQTPYDLLSADLNLLNVIGQVLGGFDDLTGSGDYFASDICMAGGTHDVCTTGVGSQFEDNNVFAINSQAQGAAGGLDSGDFTAGIGIKGAPGVSIPEPATLALIGIGIAGLGARARKRA